MSLLLISPSISTCVKPPKWKSSGSPSHKKLEEKQFVASLEITYPPLMPCMCMCTFPTYMIRNVLYSAKFFEVEFSVDIFVLMFPESKKVFFLAIGPCVCVSVCAVCVHYNSRTVLARLEIWCKYVFCGFHVKLSFWRKKNGYCTRKWIQFRFTQKRL